MTFEEKLEINTSEGVDLDLTIAGIGSRSLAWLVDGLLLLITMVVLGIGGMIIQGFSGDSGSLLAGGITSVIVLFVPMAYLVGMETLNGGRTLGKLAAGIKTVKTSGAPAGFGSVLIRTLILPFEMSLFGIGVISMLVTRHSRRIGDLAAGTVVVRDRTRVPTAASPIQLPTVDDESRWDVSAITEEEIGAIRRFLERSHSLPQLRRETLARNLYDRVAPRVGGGDHRLHPESFLSRVLAEKISRR